MRTMPSVKVLIVLLAAIPLCACGQKGPLYLPDDADNSVTQAAPAPVTSEARRA